MARWEIKERRIMLLLKMVKVVVDRLENEDSQEEGLGYS
jgi:hypothetical protein